MPIAASEVAVAGRSSQLRDEQEQRHDHDPAADAEERAEEAGDETDQDQAHRAYATSVAATTDALLDASHGRAAAKRPSSSTSTACSRRSSSGPRTRTRRPRRAPSSRGSSPATRSSPSSAGGPATTCASASASTASSYVGSHGLELDRQAERWRQQIADFAARRAVAAVGDRAEGAVGRVPLPPPRRRGGGRARARGDRRASRATKGSSRASAARCSRCCRRSARTRERRCGTCSTAPGSRARSSPATTRPTSTRSAPSRSSSTACASPCSRRSRRRMLAEHAELVLGSTGEFLELLRKL